MQAILSAHEGRFDEARDFMDGITLSLGVACGQLSQDLITEADANLYHSKENGKNAVTYTHDGNKTILRSDN